MALIQTQIMLNAVTASKLCAARTGRKSLIIKNHDAAIVVTIGSSSVTATGATGGVQLKANDQLTLADPLSTLPQEEFWAIAASGTPIVGVIEQLY